MTARRMGELAVSCEVLLQALYFPKDVHLVDARYDVVSDRVRLFLGGPGMPEVQEGAYPDLLTASYTTHFHQGHELLDWQPTHPLLGWLVRLLVRRVLAPREWTTVQFMGFEPWLK